MKYAFLEQNLHRVGLTVYEYNSKAQALYERLGFVVEGRKRQAVYHDGHYYDHISMGMLCSEWEAARRQPQPQVVVTAPKPGPTPVSELELYELGW